jgi:O-acetyl-ADP-ribose deacetylase (regulator of RNase III)
MKAKVNKVTIQVIQEDILSLSVKCLVNGTDPNLALPPALALKAGPSVQQACEAIGWCEIGSAVITTAGKLQFDSIIHAVGPRWGEGSERGKLANVTLACLRLAEHHRLRSIVFPAISTGALGYPIENCAKTMLSQIIDFTFENLKHLRTVLICLDNVGTYRIFHNEFSEQVKELKDTGEGEVQVQV